MKSIARIIILGIALGASTTLQAQEPQPKVHFSFNNYTPGSGVITDESGNQYTAMLKNEATIVEAGGLDGVLSLGTQNGFLDLGAAFGTKVLSTLNDYTLSVFVCIDSDAVITNNGNFVFSFGNSEQIATDGNGCMFFSAKNTRYAISPTNWTAEQAVTTDREFEKGKWKHLAISYNGSTKTAKLFIDGALVASSTNVSMAPKALGTPAYNFIGKSSYALNGDAYLQKTRIDEFRMYDTTLNDDQVLALGASLPEMNTAWYTHQLNEMFASLEINQLQSINKNISLPKSEAGISIVWSSSDTETISPEGVVTRPTSGTGLKSVTLTATATKAGISVSKEFTLTVVPQFTDESAVQFDTEALVLSGSLDNLRSNLTLPVVGFEGSSIQWTSSKPELLSNNGTLNYLPEAGTGKTNVTLTAKISKGTSSETRTFELLIAEKEGFSAYLFAYFTGNSQSQEALRFAISNDGFTFKALNGNQPILDSKAISTTGGIRDPHILRGHDGKSYYMVATDMVSANGWNSNRAMILLKSENLTDWTTSGVNISTDYPAFANVQRVWAPQVIFDAVAQKYMLYWSMSVNNDTDKFYYAYINNDFTALESEPKVLFANPAGTPVIDADIVQKDGLYHLFFKTEGEGFGIKKATSATLTGDYQLMDKYLQSTTNAVEGGCVYRMFDTDTWILMYDMYTSNAYQFTQSTDLENFTVVPQKVNFDFTPRHGTIIPITPEEATALMKKWGKASDVTIQKSTSEAVKKINVKLNQTMKTIYLPVRYGTDISNFDPKFVAFAGCTVLPAGPQDFSNGAVNYTVSVDGLASKTYAVTVEVANNPVLEGYYADPEILYSHKNKKFYMYPTSDGFVGWSGSYFKTFSSTDLVNWVDEGVILNLPTDVKWGTYNAWAPGIAEKKVNGTYKYFYYFVAAGNIGVAVADEPTGPFVDSGKKLVDNIDPAVYTDTITGKSYLYWGNTTLYVAELNDDMVSIKSSTKKTITPTDGTFREGIYVVRRNGTYYFFWSEDDTRSANYRVRYGTSTSPFGPIAIPANNLILAKDATLGIYGTGHNSVLQIPGRDEWYMVYHRFNRPRGISMQGDSAGYFREVCIDKLEFNADGSVRKVQPTVQGIAPVDLNSIPNSIIEIESPANKGELRSTEYFGIDGRRVSKAQLRRGVYIEKQIWENGSIETRKLVIQ